MSWNNYGIYGSSNLFQKYDPAWSEIVIFLFFCFYVSRLCSSIFALWSITSQLWLMFAIECTLRNASLLMVLHNNWISYNLNRLYWYWMLRRSPLACNCISRTERSAIDRIPQNTQELYRKMRRSCSQKGLPHVFSSVWRRVLRQCNSREDFW